MFRGWWVSGRLSILPLNGRSYDELLTLNPGVVNFTWEKTGGIGVSNSTDGNNFAVSGNRPQQNLFLLNGVEFTGAAENNMQPGGTSQQLLGVDAVREFNVLRDSYGAEYGKRPGAQVLIVTKSGTNELHGSLYEFLRNNALDARNFFDPRVGARASSAISLEYRSAGRSRRTRPSCSAISKGFQQHLHQTGVDLVPDNNARNGYLALQAGHSRAQSLPGLRTGVRRRFAADQRVARAHPGRARFRRHLGGVQQSAADHSRRFRHRPAGPHLLAKDTLSAVYTIDDSADFTPTSTNVVQHRCRRACASRWPA